MGVFAFGERIKENNSRAGKNSLPAGITSAEIEKFLKKKVMFFCNHYQCTMQEKHCVSYQIKSVEGFKPGTSNLYRPECDCCSQGRKIAKKHSVSLPPKIESKICRGCGLLLPLSDFYKFDSGNNKYSSRCKDCSTQYNKNYLKNKRAEVA